MDGSCLVTDASLSSFCLFVLFYFSGIYVLTQRILWLHSGFWHCSHHCSPHSMPYHHWTPEKPLDEVLCIAFIILWILELAKWRQVGWPVESLLSTRVTSELELLRENTADSRYNYCPICRCILWYFPSSKHLFQVDISLKNWIFYFKHLQMVKWIIIIPTVWKEPVIVLLVYY